MKKKNKSAIQVDFANLLEVVEYVEPHAFLKVGVGVIFLDLGPLGHRPEGSLYSDRFY